MKMMKRVRSSLIIILSCSLLFSLRGQASENFTPVYVTATARVSLTGDRSSGDVGAGEFSVYIISESREIPLNSNERISSQGGVVELGSFSFKKEGVYPFLVYQRDSNGNGMDYDQTKYRILFEVKKNSTGALTCTTHFLKGSEYVSEIVFHNTYHEETEGVLYMETIQSEEEREGLREITQSLWLTNNGGKDLTGIYVRAYVPSYTQYLSHSSHTKEDLGMYGVIKGQEHTTFFIPTLAPGEERELTVTYRVHSCLIQETTFTQKWFYEITGETVRPLTNGIKDPQDVITLDEIK